MRRRADRPATIATPFPKEYGGRDGSNLGMAIIREHLAARASGCTTTCRTRPRSSATTCRSLLLLRDSARRRRRTASIRGIADGRARVRVRPHRARARVGRDVAWTPTPSATGTSGSSTARRRGTPASTSRRMTWCSPAPVAKRATADGITCFLVPTDAPGLQDRASTCGRSTCPPTTPRVSLTDVRVPAATRSSAAKADGLAVAQHFVHENRIRQAASCLGAAQYCIDAGGRIRQTAQALRAGRWPRTRRSSSHWSSCRHRGDDAAQPGPQDGMVMDRSTATCAVSDKVAMCNYRANRLVCDAADRAMQVHGGHRLFAPQALRAHLPPPSPLPDHGGRRRRSRCVAWRSTCSAS